MSALCKTRWKETRLRPCLVARVGETLVISCQTLKIVQELNPPVCKGQNWVSKSIYMHKKTPGFWWRSLS